MRIIWFKKELAIPQFKIPHMNFKQEILVPIRKILVPFRTTKKTSLFSRAERTCRTVRQDGYVYCTMQDDYRFFYSWREMPLKPDMLQWLGILALQWWCPSCNMWERSHWEIVGFIGHLKTVTVLWCTQRMVALRIPNSLVKLLPSTLGNKVTWAAAVLLFWPLTRGSQRDVVYLRRPVAPSYMSPNAKKGECCGVSPMSKAVHMDPK